MPKKVTVWCGDDLRRLKVDFPACVDGFGWFFITVEARAVSLVCVKGVCVCLCVSVGGWVCVKRDRVFPPEN
jgi:hypothetical protein